AATGDVPSLASAITGEAIRGSWWGHARSHEIFALTKEVLVCRLVDGKITYVHRRLWPALARAATRFPRQRLARVEEVHTASGRHVTKEAPGGFPGRSCAKRHVSPRRRPSRSSEAGAPSLSGSPRSKPCECPGHRALADTGKYWHAERDSNSRPSGS